MPSLTVAETVLGPVTGPLRFAYIETKTTLPSSPTSVGAARRFVRDVLMHRHVNQKAVETVELLTSEVVTNALVHARSVKANPDEGPDLVVRMGRGFVRVEVYDVSPQVPVRRNPDLLDPSGRGLWIVDELSRDWGVDHLPTGKRVWFEVAFRISPLSAWSRGRAT